MATYFGFDVFELEPREAISQDIRNDHTIRGRIWQKQSKVTPEVTERILEFSVVQKDQIERNALREFYVEKKGQLTPFWVKSGQVDYVVDVFSAEDSNTIRVRSLFAINELLFIKRHIFLKPLNQFVEILGVSTENENTILTVNPIISGDLNVGAEIQNLFFVRFETGNLSIDSNGLAHDPVTSGAVLRMKELQGETPSNG